MTTHDQHTQADELDVGDRAVTATAATDTPTVAMKPLDQTQSESESSSEETLFADDELTELRARWASIQAEFVDNPKVCVEKADGLLSELIENLTSGFAVARSRLEQQWARGERASTEDLRVALRQYRAFFERLLAV
jgi:hypothetical protein